MQQKINHAGSAEEPNLISLPNVENFGKNDKCGGEIVTKGDY